ncbi:MAG: hypothetical protein IJJ35_10075 [Exiguobacterium sp.]|uniref:hypothetical protein n=1 Tax=unclassified Exiguobacterium TaxID=2644629 RepID=UPI001BE87A8B|nr:MULTISPECIES: hypothetical protein [unclassified Exiguobacterium]MBQ6459928.1 hypothetical protein [Exiguobacterium sp.]
MSDLTFLMLLFLGLTLGVVLSIYHVMRQKRKRSVLLLIGTLLVVSGYVLVIGNLTFGYGWGALWWAVVGLAMNVFGLIVHLFVIIYHLLKKRRVRS